ncbi:MAG: glycosyltransferase [Phycisphaerales bacterium]
MSVWTILMLVACAITAIGLVMTVINLRLYRAPAPDASPQTADTVSVCIPARNEEANIEACVRSMLDGDYPNVQVVVFDDDSTDRTPTILGRMAEDDQRVVIAPHAPLPEGWVGKQHACMQAARAASGDWLLFTDADVRFAPDAIRRTLAQAQASGAPLVSTFPFQKTGTLSEAVIVPMIFFILFSYLPMPRMRRTTDPGTSAGCGQFLFVRADVYRAIGGHEAWKDSMHDGIRMPRAVRKAGHRTDLFDGTDLCNCRMYEGFSQTWRGFAKNAYEGLGSVPLLVFVTIMHVVGHLLPWTVLVLAALRVVDPIAAGPAVVAIGLAFAQRLMLADRFRHPHTSVMLHPLGVLAMTLIQWHSLLLHSTGRRSWRGRTASHAA